MVDALYLDIFKEIQGQCNIIYIGPAIYILTCPSIKQQSITMYNSSDFRLVEEFKTPAKEHIPLTYN